jgi:hypothetical protein
MHGRSQVDKQESMSQPGLKTGVQSFFSHSLTHLKMKAENLRPPLAVAHVFKALKRNLKPSIQGVD